MGNKNPRQSQSRAQAGPPIQSKIALVYTFLAIATVIAWAWAGYVFHAHPVLLGTAFLAYTLGLRHAVDADHIAMIDNSTRKLLQEGQRPVYTGFFFALGHSLVVILASAFVALTAGVLKAKFASWQNLTQILGTCISVGFLLTLALVNLAVFMGLYRNFRRGENLELTEPPAFLGGFFSWLLRPFFKLILHSWHLFPIGFLFGLGFDTSTEVALLGISAQEMVRGLALGAIMIFPLLFTAGMTLVDTTDGILMLGAYRWAFMTPQRKLYYNMIITAVSVVVALAVGVLEILGLFGAEFSLSTTFWSFIGTLNDHFDALGIVIISLFTLIWAASVLLSRRNQNQADLATPSVFTEN